MFLLVTLIVLLSGCTDGAVSSPDIVTIALDLPPTNLDPRVGIDATSERLFLLLFSSLVKTSETFTIEPDLALRWEVPDPRTYIFHLREGVRFHDGRPLTAADVAYTFRTTMDGTVRTAKAGTYRIIDSIAAPDDRTVVFKLKGPFAPFLWNLTLGIVPEGSPRDFGRNPIGSGAFQFVHHIQDEEVLLKRNDAYYGVKPVISTARFKIIPEAIVRALELRKGTVDAAQNVIPPDMVEVLKKDSDLRVMTKQGTNYQYIAFNLKDPIFRDIRVRKAVAHAIDREQIVKYLWRDQARIATGVIPPNNWSFEANVTTYPFDPERARQLLKESGHENMTFTYKTSMDETSRLLASVIQHQLRDVGVRMDIRSNEFATFFADVVSGNFQMFSARWVGGNNEPDHFNLIFHSRMVPPNGANRGHYFNPEVDELIETGQREMDPEKRKRAYRRIQQIVAEELPYLSMFYPDNVCVYNKRIEGMKLYPSGGFEFLTGIKVAFSP